MKKLFLYFRNVLIGLFVCLVLFLVGAGVWDRLMFPSRVDQIFQCQTDLSQSSFLGSDAVYVQAVEWNQIIIEKQSFNRNCLSPLDWITTDKWNKVEVFILPTFRKDK